MKKIIAAFDGLKYSDSTERYALDYTQKYNCKLFAVFLEDITYHSYKITGLVAEDVESGKAEKLRRYDIDKRENAIKHFNRQCTAAGIDHSTHRDRNIAINELVHESLFADMIIIQNNETLTHYSEDVPTSFISDLLERSECPVLAVPPLFRRPEKVIFLYDGEPSSIFAIKQFTHLFPDEKLHIELICVNKKERLIPDNHLLREWIRLTYPDASYQALVGYSHEEILNYLKEQAKTAIVVLGAYGRGMVSRILHKSLADVLMKNIDMPLFIAHK